MDANLPIIPTEESMSHAAQSIPTQESGSSQDLMAMINGYWKTQAVYCMAKLGLADLLAEGPKGSDALAQATETHPPSLYSSSGGSSVLEQPVHCHHTL